MHPPVIKFKDERTSRRVHEHLVNEDDKISETDIKNIKTKIPPGNDVFITLSNKNKENEPVAGNEEINPESEKIEDNTEPGIQTSWNLPES